MKQTAFVTGASSGIGKQTARQLQHAGYQVYAAARRVEQMKDLQAEGITPVYLDLTDDESIQTCVHEVLCQTGRIDVLVNNAGYGSYGAVEDVPLSEARRQFEVNVFGLARLIQLATPTMRAQGAGKIVNVSSMGGKIWTKFGGWYHAAKYAVEGLSDCLRLELQPFGIDVIVVEPGGVQTEWVSIATEHLKEISAHGPYAERADQAAAGMLKNYQNNHLSSPDFIARTICKAVTARRPRTRYLVGFAAKPMVWLHHVFGDRAFDWVIRHFS